MKSKVLMVVAGSAMSFGAAAFALNPNLDRDRAYQAELAADASIKTQQLATANGGGFKLTSGNSSLNIGGYSIFRQTFDFRDDGDANDPLRVGDHDSFTRGFALPHTKLQLWGNVEDPGLTYFLRFAASDFNTGGGFVVEQAYVTHLWDSGFYFRTGQFQLPFLREDYVDDSMQLLADRSFTVYQFNPSYVQGIEVGYKADAWRLNVDFTDGIRSANTDWNSPAEADWALTGRVEFQAMGNDWSAWDDFTSWKGSPNALLIGAAVHAEQTGETGDGADGTPPDSADPGNTLFMYTVDVSWESDGWNLFGAFVGSNDDPNASGANSFDNFGLVIQGGVFVADQWELFARWDTFFPDKNLPNPAPNLDPKDYTAIAAGVNYYLFPKSHAAKFTGVLVWHLDEYKNLTAAPGGVLPGFTPGAPVPDTRTGTLGDSSDGEIAVQLQFQLKF